MDNLNASLTDKTGKEIVEAIQALGGGGVSHSGSSSDSPFMLVHVVASYPGEEEDPYIGTYETDPETGELLSPPAWLDCTYQEILNKINNGIPVFVLLNETIEDTLYPKIYGVSLITLHDDENSIDLMPIFRNEPTHLFMADKKDDYPWLDDQNSGGDTPISN